MDILNFSKCYFHNDSKLSIMEDNTKGKIIEIVKQMSSSYKDENKDLLDKVNFIVNETLINIFKYENSNRFMIAVDNVAGDIKLTIRIVGDTFDINKIKELIEFKEKGGNSIGKLGIWSCKKISKAFELNEIKHPIFKKEIVYLIGGN